MNGHVIQAHLEYKELVAQWFTEESFPVTVRTNLDDFADNRIKNELYKDADQGCAESLKMLAEILECSKFDFIRSVKYYSGR